ncbi:DUF2510 domain-containing protein [Agromyces sp. NPDC057865]|uniref:DUF2510 domain-containing protein n=1 Tax=Agromyces sp. NPDC057865 TaxID=3346267 RepID=UPI00366DA94D
MPERRTAGWYDEATDATLLRYWDGTKWSPHTAPRPRADGALEASHDALAALFGSAAPTVTVTMPLRAPDEHTTVPLPDESGPVAREPRERRDPRRRVGGRR